MRTQKTFWIMAALLALAAGWIGRAAWRAHRRLVSLDVYNVPVADVLKKIERQTWAKIRWDENLSAPITLHVEGQPLAAVLERIAGQAGAHFTTVYAAYANATALNSLDTSLRRNGKTEEAGWTRLAPKAQGADPLEGAPKFGGPGDEPDGPPEGKPRRMILGPRPGEGGDVDIAPGGPGAGPGPGQLVKGGGLMVRHEPNGVTIVQDGSGEVEEWLPTELLVETAAKGKIGEDAFREATPENAMEAAKKIQGDWTTFYVFRKTKFPALARGGPGLPPSPMRDGKLDLSHAQREPLERFANLTPHERVERARQRPGRMMIQRNN